MPVQIIAEIGINHNADLDLAIAMIREAAKSGADVIKFQTAVPELVQTKNAPMAEYQVKNTGKKVSQLEMSRNFHFPLEVFSFLKSEVESYNKIFMSTAFDLKSLDFLTGLGEEYFKIPSGELTNLPYLREIGSRAKKVLMSTGMASWNEVQDALKVLLDCGLHKEQITILQCNTEYPTPVKDVNLNAMLTIQKEFAVAVGYSDHTLGIEVDIAAVAMGASIIEKHFTLDNAMEGPDHKASLEPEELKAMVSAIRNIEKALGSNEKILSPSEEVNINIVRKSIVASCPIRKGELLSEKNISTKRPGTGISPMKWDEIIGVVATKDYQADETI